MPHGGVNSVHPTRQAARARWSIPQPGGALPSSSSTSRPIHGFGSTVSPGSKAGLDKDCTSVVGVATCGSAAPVW
jgi:hypothetical protein